MSDCLNFLQEDKETMTLDDAYAVLYGVSDYSPEKRLLLAVLQRAVDDLYGPAEEKNSAVSWFIGETVECFDGHCFTFQFVVEALDLGHRILNALEERVRSIRRGAVLVKPRRQVIYRVC